MACSQNSPTICDGSPSDSHEFRPHSLWECYHLLTSPLSRDHLLVKGLEKRNRVSYGDIITGISTESETEAVLRRSIALENVPRYISELNARNIPVLGDGLVRQLLAIETDVDDDGVPLEADEEKVTNVVGSLIAVMRLRAPEPMMVDKLVSSILKNKEVLFYTKYKLLKSVNASVNYLVDVPRYPDSITAAPSTALYQLSNPPVSNQSVEITRIKQSFCSSMASVVSRQIAHVLADCDQMKFVGHVFVIELINSLMTMYQDVSELESAIESIGMYICRADTLDTDVVKNFLRLLLLDKRVLIELVEDEDLVKLLRRVMKKLDETIALEPEAKKIVQVVRGCIDPYYEGTRS